MLHLVGEVHGSYFARTFARGFGIFADAADHHAAQIELRAVAASFLRAFFHDAAGVGGKLGSGDAGGEQTLGHGTGQTLQDGAGGADVERRLPARNVSVGLEGGSESLKSFAFVFDFVAGEHSLDDFDAFAHDRGGTDLPALFALADFLQVYRRQSAHEARGVLCRTVREEWSIDS